MEIKFGKLVKMFSVIQNSFFHAYLVICVKTSCQITKTDPDNTTKDHSDENLETFQNVFLDVENDFV